MSKSARYYYDADAVREPGAGKWNSKHFGSGPKIATTDDRNRSLMRTWGFGTYHEDVERSDRNCRTVWTVPSQPYAAAHFAVFPPKLIEPCIKAGARAGDTILDPFMGSGTTAMVARNLGCPSIGVELNAEYIDLAACRLAQGVLEFA